MLEWQKKQWRKYAIVALSSCHWLKDLPTGYHKIFFASFYAEVLIITYVIPKLGNLSSQINKQLHLLATYEEDFTLPDPVSQLKNFEFLCL